MNQEAQQVPDSVILKKPNKLPNRFKYNQLLYNMFVCYDFPAAKKIIAQIYEEFGESHEFANLIQGHLLKMNGNLQISIDTFKKCLIINDKDAVVLKNISKNLQLMGRYKASLEVAQEALKYNPHDWELHFTMGNCFSASRDQATKAFTCYSKAFELSKNETTFSKMGRLYTQQENYEEALRVYKSALHYSQQNQEIMTIMGLLLMRLEENAEALKILEQASAIDPKETRSLLGLGSILQDAGQLDQSLNHYRNLLIVNPNSAQVWSNIGMCYYGKDKCLAAVACLRKALYFDPFEWIIHFNLGLVHLYSSQYASAFHFFQSAITLNPDEAQSYMYLGIALDKLGDFQNACRAFDRALDIEKDYLIYLNYSIVLLNNEHLSQGIEMYNQFNRAQLEMKGDTRFSKQDIWEKKEELKQLLNG